MIKPPLLFFAILLAASLTASGAKALEAVVASIKPVHSLVSMVMEGISKPQLLVKGAGSPHAYALRPSEARMLESAQVVFWIGPGLELFLEGALETLAEGARVVALSQTPGLRLLEIRSGGSFEAHDGHGDKNGYVHHHDDSFGHYDMHVWLDPENARLMIRRIAEVLSDADPQNATAYLTNAEKAEARLDALVSETQELVQDAAGKPFVVFHDAYQYFERRFSLSAIGSLTISPDVMPGAQRLGEIRSRIAELDAACIFVEPQFEPRLVQTVAEGTSARPGVLDPLGAGIEDGPELYFTLIRNMGQSFAACLSSGSSTIR
ncbi:zinc ABC transporter substrate-binding protein [Chelativorans sp. Marseille-P2723]|uniref:zinc ABC transporter substrate-binding protein n=1 Tax=Chelativorans sp. Marseille-P2723 TaxID=2709133 RepID=UPI0015712505|nr:zinc ABC transporter substrate-binding protein [Chelativorans sp. Marseille-P2723]